MNVTPCKLKIEPSGFLLLSVLLFFMDFHMLLAVAGNVAIHEWGHICMLRRRGVYIRCITLSCMGLCIVCNMDFLHKRHKVLCAVGGPLFGLLFALTASALGNLTGSSFLCLFAGVGIVLSVFNLLPIDLLDGGRVLEALLPKLARPVSVVASVILECVGLYVMAAGYGTGLALLGLLLLMGKER